MAGSDGADMNNTLAECEAYVDAKSGDSLRGQTDVDVAIEIAVRAGITWMQIVGRTRQKEVTRCREDITVALRNRGMSFPEIGRMMGRSGHSTYFDAYERAMKRAKELV